MSLVASIEALVNYAKGIHRIISNEAALDELTRLDTAVYVECARAGLLAHLPNPGPPRNSYNSLFGKTKLWIASHSAGGIVFVNRQWLADMEALRTLALDEEATAELTPSSTSSLGNANPSDTKSDTRKKAAKKRSLTPDATKAATEIRRRKERNNFQSLEADLPSIIEDLEIKSKPSTIKRILSDNPDSWKT